MAITLEVGLRSAHIEDVSSVPLFRGAASIENVFAPHKSRNGYSDHENQGESDGNDDSLAASHVNSPPDLILQGALTRPVKAAAMADVVA